MMSLRCASASLLLSLLAGCSKGQDAANDESPVPDSMSVAHLDCPSFSDSVFTTLLTRSGLAQVHGQADSVEAVTEPNRHVEGAIDSIFVVHYPGLRVVIRKPVQGTDLVSEAEASDNRYLRYPALGVGAPADRVRRILGVPHDTVQQRWTYDCSMGAGQPVTFWMASGQVQRIIVSFYVD